MKNNSLVLFFVVFFFNPFQVLSQTQIIIDRSEQVPVSINAIFFIADFELTNPDKKRYSYHDLGLGKGQIFTYKGNIQREKDFQSLVLINAYVLNESNGEYIAYDENEEPLLGVEYEFKLLLACMSSIAKAPTGELNSNDIVPSEYGVPKEEVKKFRRKYSEKIDAFLENKLSGPLATRNDDFEDIKPNTN